MPIAFIIGTAGSGKSLFTAAFSEWLKLSKQDVAVVNLDPGVLKLPYSPDVDVRNYVDVGNIMEKYGLGPNGAVILAADLIADEVENLTRDIEAVDADIVLVDTPGQMELFAFIASGPYIVDELRTSTTRISCPASMRAGTWLAPAGSSFAGRGQSRSGGCGRGKTQGLGK